MTVLLHRCAAQAASAGIAALTLYFGEVLIVALYVRLLMLEGANRYPAIGEILRLLSRAEEKLAALAHTAAPYCPTIARGEPQY